MGRASRLATAVGLVALVLVTVAVVGSVSGLIGRPAVTPLPSGSTASSAAPSSSASAAASLIGVVGYRDGAYAPSVKAPTSDVTQSKLWFAQGAWWAVMSVADAGETRIFRLDAATQVWQDTGTVVDDHAKSRADVVWDGRRAIIASSVEGGKNPQPTLVGAYVFDTASHRFQPVPDGPVPIASAPGRAQLALDPTGRAWMLVLNGDSLRVLHTLADPFHWSAPAAVGGVPDGQPLAAAITTDRDGITIVAATATSTTLLVAHHVATAADTVWQREQHAVPDLPGSITDLAATEAGKGTTASLVVAVRAKADPTANVTNLRPELVLSLRNPDGSWREGVVARLKDHPGPPAVIVDADAASVSVVYAVPGSGSIAWKRATIASLLFPVGEGDAVLAASGSASIANPSLPKQPFDPASGVVVIASDDTAGAYFHAQLGEHVDGLPAARLDTAAPIGKPTPLPAVPTVIANDSFASWAAGALGTWTVDGTGGGSGRLVVVRSTGADRIVRLQPVSARGAAQACRDVFPTASGRVTISTLISVAALGVRDIVLTDIRGPGGSIGSVRITKHGFAAYYRGQAKVTTTARVLPGVWYRSTVTIDLGAHTYTWRLQRLRGSLVLATSRIGWRAAAVPSMNGVCMTTADNSPRTAIAIDSLLVERLP